VKSLVQLLHGVLKIHKQHQSPPVGINVGTEKMQVDTLGTAADLCMSKPDCSDSVTSDMCAERCVVVLRAGLHMLHLVWQLDTAFYTRHAQVQHTYVQVVCGLSHTLRQAPASDNDCKCFKSFIGIAFCREDRDVYYVYVFGAV